MSYQILPGGLLWVSTNLLFPWFTLTFIIYLNTYGTERGLYLVLFLYQGNVQTVLSKGRQTFCIFQGMEFQAGFLCRLGSSLKCVKKE